MRNQENKLISAFPFIDWLRPHRVTNQGKSALVCKFCVALHGLDHPEYLAGCNNTEAEFKHHIFQVHGIKLLGEREETLAKAS